MCVNRTISSLLKCSVKLLDLVPLGGGWFSVGRWSNVILPLDACNDHDSFGGDKTSRCK